jgi:hypothetical protein
MRMSGLGTVDPTDEHQQVPVQVPAAKLAEIKQQWDEVKRLIKENRPHPSINWRAVMFVATLAVAGWLAYAAYDDLAMRQKEMVVTQGKVLGSVDKLRRDFEREMKELKSHLGDAMRAGSADEIKLLRNVESSVRRLEERMKAKKH